MENCKDKGGACWRIKEAQRLDARFGEGRAPWTSVSAASSSSILDPLGRIFNLI